MRKKGKRTVMTDELRAEKPGHREQITGNRTSREQRQVSSDERKDSPRGFSLLEMMAVIEEQ
jgi:hypothetical protein